MSPKADGRIGQSIGVLVAAWTFGRFSATPLFACASAGMLLLTWTFAWLLSKRNFKGLML